MTVLFVGTSHATAPLATIERLGFPADEAAALLARLAASDMRRSLPLRELVILSNCYRVELYGVPADDGTRPSVALDAMAQLLASRAGPNAPELDAQVRRLVGTEATRHLFRVAAGLESMVIGESEVLTQVSGALGASLRVGAAGAVLTPLFETAVRAGRRARAETTIASAPENVSSIAAELAEELAEDLRGRRALFVGAGQIAEMAGNALRDRGYWEITIAAPPGPESEALTKELGATLVPCDALPRALAETDLVFVCVAASTVVDAAMVKQAMRGRMARPLAFVDLAADDTLDTAVSELPGVRVVGPAELRERIDRAVAGRRREAPMVETIVEEELRLLQARAEGHSLSGVVAALRTRAEEIRQRELARALAGLPEIHPEVRAQIEWLSVSLVNKLLDEPTRRLRAEAGHGPANPYADVTRELFGLPGERAPDLPAA